MVFASHFFIGIKDPVWRVTRQLRDPSTCEKAYGRVWTPIGLVPSSLITTLQKPDELRVSRQSAWLGGSSLSWNARASGAARICFSSMMRFQSVLTHAGAL